MLIEAHTDYLKHITEEYDRKVGTLVTLLHLSAMLDLGRFGICRLEREM